MFSNSRNNDPYEAHGNNFLILSLSMSFFYEKVMIDDNVFFLYIPRETPRENTMYASLINIEPVHMHRNMQQCNQS